MRAIPEPRIVAHIGIQRPSSVKTVAKMTAQLSHLCLCVTTNNSKRRPHRKARLLRLPHPECNQKKYCKRHQSESNTHLLLRADSCQRRIGTELRNPANASGIYNAANSHHLLRTTKQNPYLKFLDSGWISQLPK